jgi:cytosine/adenosine deaminase-related metal-dependent hydrolase
MGESLGWIKETRLTQDRINNAFMNESAHSPFSLPSRECGKPWTMTARWVLPVEGQPLAGGCLVIQGEQIVAVLPRRPGRIDVDWGDAAIIPGMVNAHCHLDLSDLTSESMPGDFLQWLQAVVKHRANASPEQRQCAINKGIAQCVRFATTIVGDIADRGVSWELLGQAPLRAVVFYEMLGISRQRARQACHDEKAWRRGHGNSMAIRRGLSPHAPYSVRRSLVRATSALGRRKGVAVSMHVAESNYEPDLLEFGRGPLVDFLMGLGVWEPGALARNLEEILGYYKENEHFLLVHANYLPEHINLGPNCTVVVCPRTRRRFGHPCKRLESFRRAGVRIALGTDSLGSAPDLNLLAEARILLNDNPEFAPEGILKMMTLDGAQALGWDQEIGSLRPGKSADLVVLNLSRQSSDPFELVFDAGVAVQAVLFRGRWSFQTGNPPASQQAPLEQGP